MVSYRRGLAGAAVEAGGDGVKGGEFDLADELT